MRTLHVRRLQPFSLAKILGTIYCALGLLGGCVFSAFSILAGGIGMAEGEDEAVLGIVFGAGAIVVIPLMYGAIGFVAGLLIGWLYNLVAGWMGGIEMEVEEAEA